LQAVIGIVQMKKIETIIKERKNQAQFFNKELENIEELVLPLQPDYAEHAYSSYMLKTSGKLKISIPELVNYMAGKNISCRFGIQPLHREPYFENRNYLDRNFPNCCEVADNSFFIPIYPGLGEKELRFIVDSLKDFLII